MQKQKYWKYYKYNIRNGNRNMYLNDLNSSQHNVNKLNKILSQTFNHEVDLSEMSTNSLNRMLTTTNAKMMAIKESDLKYWENPQYNKLGLIAHQIKEYLSEIAPTRTDGKKMKTENTVMEADLDQAEVLLAAQELVDQMQGMVEDVAEMQVQKLMPIVDAMKEQVGFEVAEAYNTAADAALSQLLDAMKTAKGAVENATLAARGEPVPGGETAPTDMGMSDADMDPEAPMDMDAEDDFGGDDAEAGEENPVGRELKGESALAQMEKDVLSEKKFLESKDKLLKMVESGSMTMEHFINVINELKNEYGVEINPAWGAMRKKYAGAPMMGDLGDGKGFREIPKPTTPGAADLSTGPDGNPTTMPKTNQQKADDAMGRNDNTLPGPVGKALPSAPPPRPKTRPDGTPFNTMAPPPTGPGGDEALPKAKPMPKPTYRGGPVTTGPDGNPTSTTNKPMNFSNTAQQKMGRTRRSPKAEFDLGDMFDKLKTGPKVNPAIIAQLTPQQRRAYARTGRLPKNLQMGQT